MLRSVLQGLLLLLFSLVSEVASAQKYVTAAGIRFESEQAGLSIQQRVFKYTTAEVIGLAARREVSATALAEQHIKLLGRRLNVYLGVGAHVGARKDSGSFYGFDGIAGLEYKVNGLPLLLSVDARPVYHINHADWFLLAKGFSVRYVFIKEKKPKQNFFQRLFKRDEEYNDKGND